MDRKNFFHGQSVQMTELNSAFDQVEKRFKDFFVDTGSNGVAKTPYRSGTNELYLLEADTPNMTVKIKPGAGYTREGNRLEQSADASVNCAVDKDGASVIPGSGLERYISVYALQDFNEGEPLPNPLPPGGTVNFNKLTSAKYEVVAGATATIAAPPTAVKPATRNDGILLADILIQDSTTQIVEAMINRDRQELLTLRSTVMQPDFILNMVQNLGEAVTARVNSWIFRENFVCGWVLFDGTAGGNPSNPFTVKSKFNVEKVERLVTSAYKIFIKHDLFASADDCFALAIHNGSFGGVEIEPLSTAGGAGDTFFTVSTWEGDPPAGVESSHVGVVFFGRPSL